MTTAMEESHARFAAQQQLAGIDDERTLQESEQARGVFTAELLERQEPERYAQAVALLADGSMSQREIARSLSMSRNSVAAVYRRALALGAVEPARKQLAAGFLGIAALTQDRLREAVMNDSEKISAKDLAIVAGVVVDKAQLLAGEPTARVEHVDGPAVTDFGDYIEAECREIPPEMHSLPEAAAANGAGQAPAAAAEIPDGEAAGDQADGSGCDGVAYFTDR